MAVVLNIISRFDDRGVKRAQTSLAKFGSSTRGFAGSTSAEMVRAGAMLDRTGVKAQQAGKRISMGATVPVVALGAASVKMATDFDASMSRIGALVGVSEGQLARYHDAVLAMSRELPQAPKELADALFFITSAGVKGKLALDVLDASAKAAAAGLGETKVVADAATSALNAYGAQNISASAATDVLVGAVREGKMAPEELAGALGKVIPVASAMGVQFDEVGAAIASMTRTGMNSREAATALRGMLTQLLKPSKKTSDGLKSVGLSVGEVQTSLREKGLLATLQLLWGAFDGNARKAAEVFGNVRGLTGVLSIMGPNAKKNADIFAKLAKSGGDTAEAFKRAKKEDPSVKFGMMKSSLQATAITLGESLLPTVKQVADKIAGLADWFGRLSPKTQDVAIKVALAAAAVGPLVWMFGSLLRTGGAVLKVVGNVGIAFGKNAKSAPLYARAIAGAAKGSAGLAKGIAGVIKSLAVQGASLVAATAKTVAHTAATVASRAAQLAAAGAAKAMAAAQWLVNAAMTANPIGLVVAAIALLVAAFVVAWKKSETFRRIVTGAWEAIKTSAKRVFEWIAGFLRAWVGRVRSALSGIAAVASWVVGQFGRLRDGAVSAVGKVVDFVRGLPGKIRSAVGNGARVLYGFGKDLLTGVWNGMKSIAGWLRDRVVGFFKDLLPGWAKKALGIESPSRVFAGIGARIGEGLAAGMVDTRDIVRRASQRLVSASLPAFGPSPLYPVAAGLAGPSATVQVLPGAVTINFAGAPASGVSQATIEATVDRAFRRLAAEITRR